MTRKYAYTSTWALKIAFFLVLFFCSHMHAQVIISKPSLSFGVCSFPSIYHPLDNIVITEMVRDDFSAFGSDPKSLVLEAPSNFEFLPGSGSAVVNGGGNLTIISFTSTATTLTIEYNCVQVNQNDKMTIFGLEIRAINGPSTGNITRTGGTGIILGCPLGETMTTTLSSTDLSGIPNVYTTVSYSPGILLWSDPSTWECGTVPPNDGTALIAVNAYQGGFHASNALVFDQDADVYSLEIRANANFSPGEGGGKTLTIRDDLNILSNGNLRNLDLPSSGSNTIQIGGDLMSNGFMVTDGASNSYNLTLEMNGTSSQSISGSGTLRMIGSGSGQSRLLINAASDVILVNGFRTTDDNGVPGLVLVNGSMRFSDENVFFSGSGDLTMAGYTELTSSTFNGHYAMTGTKVLSSTSTIEFTNPISVLSLGDIPSSTLGNLTCNVTAAGTLDLNDNVIVTGTLSMVSGVINTNTTTLSIGSSISNLGSLDYQGGMINGTLKRWFSGTNSGSASGLYPLSRNGTLKRFATIEYTENTDGGSIKGEWVDTHMGYNVTTDTISTACNGSFIVEETTSGYWSMTPNEGITTNENKNYTITLEADGIYEYGDACHMTALKRVGSGAWNSEGTHVDNTGSASSPLLQRTGVSGWSNWGFGGGSGTPLPVTLSSFTSDCSNQQIDIQWITESEYNSSHFDLLRSRDGLVWQVIYTVPAAGNSNTERTYSFVDQQDQDCYYKLIQYDIDGKSETYGPIYSECAAQLSYIKSYPNPSMGHFNLVINDSGFTGESRLEFCTPSGNIVHTESLTVKDGINLFVIDTGQISAGMYVLRLSNGNNLQVLKHTVE